MQRILIFGNSGSGKSTLARKLVEQFQLTHLDLDTLAWLPHTPPRRTPLDESKHKINHFMQSNADWVIEGCYTDLLEHAATSATEAVFMNLSTEHCIRNARKRPWEPHKYASKSEQDANLEMLIDWIKAYSTRDDTFSHRMHQSFFESFIGIKKMYTENI